MGEAGGGPSSPPGGRHAPGKGPEDTGGSEPDAGERRRERLVALFRRAPIVRTFGMTLSYDEEGRAVIDLPRNPDLDHAAGDVHGGVIATLLDSAAWFTAAPRYEGWISTVEFDTRLLEPAGGGDLRAVGDLLRAGRRLSTARAECRDGEGRLVAVGTGTFTVTGVDV